MAKLSETQELARYICRMVTDDCVMDERPCRVPCKMSNCQMMPIAMDALLKTGRRRRLVKAPGRPVEFDQHAGVGCNIVYTRR